MSAAALGRIYFCPVCGAQIILIRAVSGALDPICCNTQMKSHGEPNPVYRCEVCGAEVALVKDKKVQELDVVCCHQPMVRREAPPVAA